MKCFISFIVFFLTFFKVNAQEAEDIFPEEIRYSVGATINSSSNGQVPFWLRTNKFGAIPLDGFSGTLRGTVHKDYDLQKKIDWGIGVDVMSNYGNTLNLQVIEAFLKVKKGAFQIKAGRSKDFIGLADPFLSSGSFSISGNALGIPKIEISLPQYTYLPFTKGNVAVKGNFSFGFIGEEPLSQRSNQIYYVLNSSASTNFHQKSFYLQIGKPESKLKLSGGFDHNVTWGDENNFFRDWNLSGFKTTVKAITGGVHKMSKVGNHIGSIDQKIEYDFPLVKLSGYHQFFYDVGGLAHFNNIKDGLWGVVLENKISVKNSAFKWNKFLFEVFLSKSQGGELDAKLTPSGDEDYYNNYLYLNGWKYKNENVGNNFITNNKYVRKELPILERESHSNNRLYLMHFGGDVSLHGVQIVGKISFSRNFGTYATSPIGNTTGGVREINPPPYFTPVNQTSVYLELSKNIKNGLQLGFAIAADQGDLLYNAHGASLSLKKKW